MNPRASVHGQRHRTNGGIAGGCSPSRVNTIPAKATLTKAPMMALTTMNPGNNGRATAKLASVSATACSSACSVSAPTPLRSTSTTTLRTTSIQWSNNVVNKSTLYSTIAPVQANSAGKTAAPTANQNVCRHEAPSRQAPPMTSPMRPIVTSAIMVVNEYDCSASVEMPAGMPTNMRRWVNPTNTSVTTAVTVPERYPCRYTSAASGTGAKNSNGTMKNAPAMANMTVIAASMKRPSAPLPPSDGRCSSNPLTPPRVAYIEAVPSNHQTTAP